MILPTFDSRQLNVKTNDPNCECVDLTVLFFFFFETLIGFANGSWQRASADGEGQSWTQGHQGSGQKMPVNEFV